MRKRAVDSKKIIIILLILAILFSAISIYISFSALDINIPRRSVSGQASSAQGGGVSLYIETPPGRETSGGGG